MIRQIIIKNYKGIKEASISFNENRNILVGNNGVGKSTVIEALTLALGLGLRDLDITPYIFHTSTWDSYQATRELPSIEIEVYFTEDKRLSPFHGKNNSLNIDVPGIRLVIAFDDAYSDFYDVEKENSTHIPCEYYTCARHWFSGEPVKQLKIPFSVKVIDSSSLLFHTRGSKYITKLAQDSLSDPDKVSMKSTLRELKQIFEENGQIKAINEKLSQKCNDVREGLSMSIDLVSQSTWNTIVHPTLDKVPLSQLGLGEQCILKTLLSVSDSSEPTIYILEEPETHLSHTKLYELLNLIERKIQGQLIITTHNSFVANKLDLKNLILLENDGGQLYTISLKEIGINVFRFFYKTVHYPTLRIALCKKAILVEGITDELVVTYYYSKAYGGRHPFQDGIELIVCNGLSFAHFVTLSKALHKKVAVITDNDHNDVDYLSSKYGVQDDLYRLFTESDVKRYTLEVAFVEANKDNLELLIKAFSKRLTDCSLEGITQYMLNNKAEWACRLLEYYDENKKESLFDVPAYIKDAINWIRKE